ncbi:mandelate racemase/muconate lactonizing enzyme family protein [Brevibacillus daliensis]|uniref:mandelate racemase/muconate lactonizing enzyme family protein n=1 Tax=Brevibacillus daliensis TaxID=2892995 RepID=UPI001E506805|nr:mandelate racemase/muconate lactonizing enzyme family protein [Brevibacillus daliensis]
MIIERIDTYPCLYELPTPYGDANGYKKYRSCYLIKITTCSGIEGWGECIDWLPTLDVGFRERIIPYLIGKNATDRIKVSKVIKKWHQRAATAVSMALTEIMAKATGLFVCQLWGGQWHERIPVYASFQTYQESADWTKHSLQIVSKAVAEGYSMAKVKIGGRTVKEDQAHISLLQNELAKSMSFALDANQSYDVATICEWQSLLQKWSNIMWIEEPLPMERINDYALLRAKLPVALAGGENILNVKPFLGLCQQGAIDIAQPDPMHEDGIDGYRHTLETMRSIGVRVSPHVFDGGLSRLYALLAQACLPPWGKMTGEEIEPVEWDVMENPFTEMISLRPVSGYVTIRQGVGIGVEIDQDLLAHYRWDGRMYQA